MQGKENNCGKNDYLRPRFTVWIEKVIVHAKLHYIRDNRKYLDIVSLEDLSEEALAVLDEPVCTNPNDFVFDDERLSVAYRSLSSLRRRILVMFFIEEKTIEEIAKELGQSVNSVYLGKCRALKTLQKAIKKQGDSL